MAENKDSLYFGDGDGDSGIVSEPRPNSQNGSPVIEREDSRHAVYSVSQLTEGVVVYSKQQGCTQTEHISSGTEEATGENNDFVPILETQGPDLSKSNRGKAANFSIGTSEEESGRSEHSVSGGSKLLLEAQKAIEKEKKEQNSRLLNTEAKLKEAKEQLAEAQEKNGIVEQQLIEVTKKKEKVEKKLEKVQAKRVKELQKYKSEVEKYKERLAEAEKKNETQRVQYESEIEKLTKEMEEKEKKYDTRVLELTQERCQLQVEVANMRAEEQSLKRQIAELQRDLECQAKESLAEKLDVLRSNSETALAEKNARIEKLERLLSEASLNSNSSQDN